MAFKRSSTAQSRIDGNTRANDLVLNVDELMIKCPGDPGINQSCYIFIRTEVLVIETVSERSD